MKAYYAQFTKDEKQPDLWNVSFPDLEGCVTYGKSLDEAVNYSHLFEPYGHRTEVGASAST